MYKCFNRGIVDRNQQPSTGLKQPLHMVADFVLRFVNFEKINITV